jgi:putative transposase
MRSGFFYEFSNYGSYDQLTEDGLTQWHLLFCNAGNYLEDGSRKYRGFCKRYNPSSKPARKCNWGNKLRLRASDLKGVKGARGDREVKSSSSSSQAEPPPPRRCQVSQSPMVSAIAERFIRANQAPERGKGNDRGNFQT